MSEALGTPRIGGSDLCNREPVDSLPCSRSPTPAPGLSLQESLLLLLQERRGALAFFLGKRAGEGRQERT